jgi:hypothetical protein
MTPPDSDRPDSETPPEDSPQADSPSDESPSKETPSKETPSIDVPGDPGDPRSGTDSGGEEGGTPTPDRSSGARIPDPISPAAGATVDEPSVTFEWERVPEAETYQVQIAKDRTFDDIVFDGRVGASSRFTYSGLPPQEGVSLYWRVRAYLPTGEWTDYGTVGTFVLADWRPDQPSLRAGEDAGAPAAETDTGESSTSEPMLLVFSLIITIVSVGLGIIYVQDGTVDDATTTTATAEDSVNLKVEEPIPNEDGETYQISIDRAMELVVERRGGTVAPDTAASPAATE